MSVNSEINTQEILTCLRQKDSRYSPKHIVYRIEVVESLRHTKLCISLFTVHFFCATSHLTFYTVQQKLKNFSPLPLLSPKFNMAYISFGYKTQWLSRSKRTKARLGVAKDTYLTKPADA